MECFPSENLIYQARDCCTNFFASDEQIWILFSAIFCSWIRMQNDRIDRIDLRKTPKKQGTSAQYYVAKALPRNITTLKIDVILRIGRCQKPWLRAKTHQIASAHFYYTSRLSHRGLKFYSTPPAQIMARGHTDFDPLDASTRRQSPHLRCLRATGVKFPTGSNRPTAVVQPALSEVR